MYWYYMQRRIFKEMERQAMVQWGYDPKAKKDRDSKKKMAERWLQDPLYAFPYDIEYFDYSQVAGKIAVSKRFWSKMAPEKRWDKGRADSCLGKYGIVAKRCSMNDKLWFFYKQAQTKKIPFTLGHVKKMIMIDIKRSKLYPPGWQDSDASPPEWYLDKLRAEGQLDRILSEIDEETKMGRA